MIDIENVAKRFMPSVRNSLNIYNGQKVIMSSINGKNARKISKKASRSVQSEVIKNYEPANSKSLIKRPSVDHVRLNCEENMVLVGPLDMKCINPASERPSVDSLKTRIDSISNSTNMFNSAIVNNRPTGHHTSDNTKCVKKRRVECKSANVYKVPMSMEKISSLSLSENVPSSNFVNSRSLSKKDIPLHVQNKSNMVNIKSKSLCNLSEGGKCSYIKLANKNVNNLINKVCFVAREIEKQDIDIFAVTESWLVPAISDAVIAINGYTVYRKDCEENKMKHGVCCYIKSDIKVGSVSAEIENTLAIELLPWNVYILVVYRPPSNNDEKNEALKNFLLTFCPDKEIIVLGDFNLPSLKWNQLAISENATPQDKTFLDIFTTLSLTQWIDKPTFFPSCNMLDLVFTSEADRMLDIELDPPFPACHHALISVTYLITAQSTGVDRPIKEIKIRHDWLKGKYRKISVEIKNIDWNYEFSCLSPTDAYAKFLETLTPLISEFIPKKKEGKNTLAPWEKNIPKDLEKNKKELWSTYKENRGRYGRHDPQTQDSLGRFFLANEEIKNYIFAQRCSYEEHLVGLVKGNPKPFHSYIRKKKRHRPSVGPLKIGNKLSADEKDMAECLVTNFKSVFVEETPPNPAPHQIANSNILNIQFSQEEIEKVLMQLDPNTSMGPDGVHPLLLKECAATIAYPIRLIATKSMVEGALPIQWKSSNITPIFKKGVHSEPLNYRPVSLTSVVCKAIERIVVTRLNQYLQDNHIINDCQYGFQKGKSVEEQLLLTYNDITRWYDEGHPVDLVLFDFAKAFDTVNHVILLKKLHKIGIKGNVLKWLQSFLTGRKMCVVIAGTKSASVPVTSGVPQGSVVGPILFIIFVNHLMSNMKNKVMMFADDLKLYIKLPHPRGENNVTYGQEDINRLVDSASSWGLRLNSSKCVVLRFRRNFANMDAPQEYMVNDAPLLEKTAHRDLGILLDSSLKFHDHIRETVFKARGTAINLLKSTVCRSPNFMVTLFVTHIRPILDFGSTVWNTGYIGDLRLLERVQRGWTKKVSGLANESYENRLRMLGIFSIQGRLLRSDIIMCWKIFNGKSTIKPTDLFALAPQKINTRGHKYKIYKPRPQTDVRKKFFSVRVVEWWNRLSPNTVNCSTLDQFKAKLACEIEEHLFEFAP